MGGERREKEGKGVVWWVYSGTMLIWGAWVGYEIRALFPVVASFLFFQCANILLRRGPIPIRILLKSSSFKSSSSKSSSSKSSKSRSRDGALFVNTCVSLLHSSLSSSVVLLILIHQKQWPWLFQHHQLVSNPPWPFAYHALSLSCGYFAYDQFDMLSHRLYSPSILSHHFLLLLCFTLALLLRFSLNYLLLTLLCEFHSLFLHLRKLRRLSPLLYPSPAFLPLECLLNFFTFIFFRLLPHSLILLKLVSDSPKFDSGFHFPLACFAMFCINSLNIALAFDLFRAYLRDFSPQLH
ncbi:hypothetical protein vseg_009574 [Gypsophila vaccaria]